MNNFDIANAMTVKLDAVLPEYPVLKEGVRRAPKRELLLNKREIKLAVKMLCAMCRRNCTKRLLPSFSMSC